MNAQEIRKKYLEFFENKGHSIVPRALMVPNNEPGVLFTGSGMQPMIPYLLGESHQSGKRLVDSQTCLRAQDIEDIGDNRHTTFFEMLGNWSLGDYFKKEQIEWIFDFLVNVVGLDVSRLYVTCFIGEPKYNIDKDTEASLIWKQLFESKNLSSGIADIGSEEDGYSRGINDGERIFFYDGSKNWWSRNGGPDTTPIGDPCGPDSEMFYDFGIEHNKDFGENCHPNCDCGRFMEIGNNVFMAYKKVADGVFEPLVAPNIDHGSGLERIAAAALNCPDVFKISVMWPIVEELERLSGKKYDDNTQSMRVVADHLRGATFLAVDGVVPSNKEQGYVMRRLMRRAIRYAFDLGIESNFIEGIVPVIAALFEEDYPEVLKRKTEVISVLAKEEKAFRQTLKKGDQILSKLIESYKAKGTVFEKAGQVVFLMHDTYGYPKELTVEHLQKSGLDLGDWQTEFGTEMMEQRARSQTAAKGTFKGGLGGHTIQHKKYHTATHLMYQALRDVLGDHVVQNGSNITEERLRFDFSHPEKVTPEQISRVEDIVNDQISRDLKVSFAEYPTKVAREEKGALGQFGDRYGDIVKVYEMIADGADKPYSFEICGGPHVDHTLQLFEEGKKFKILKEESSSSGIRRIKAALV
jgi:alanyl-tRNA synthetase